MGSFAAQDYAQTTFVSLADFGLGRQLTPQRALSKRRSHGAALPPGFKLTPDG